MFKIAFLGFWPSFNIRRNFLLDAIAMSGVRFRVVDSPIFADVIFHSHFKSLLEKAVFKKTFKNKINIFFSGEATEFDTELYQGSISSRKFVQGNHYRLPLWKIYIDYVSNEQRVFKEDSVSKWYLENVPSANRVNKKYAAGVFSNMNSVRRYMVADIKKCGPIDVYGKSGIPLQNKMEVLTSYKFNLCPENAIVPGYITEKIVHAKACGCIPIWYGDRDYHSDFNKGALVNMLEFEMNSEMMMDSVDFKLLAETPLLREATDFRPELANFLSRTIL